AGGALTIDLRVEPRDSTEIRLAVEPIVDGRRRSAPAPTFIDDGDGLGTVRRQLRAETTELTTTNPTVARAWRTAVEDLASLPFGHGKGPAAPIAGLPLYLQFFGRDTL